jgi:uncharacterized protein
MKLHTANADGLNSFTAYGDGYVSVNGRRFEANLTVLPGKVFENWTAADFDSLSEADFEFLAGLEADIVLLGTGKTCRFPPGRLMRPIAEQRVGLEVMDSHAACRTYNILVAEGRKVACALLIA